VTRGHAPGRDGHDRERHLSIFDDPKIDCHNHVFDPARFEFSPKAYYLPAGAELGTRSQLTALFEAYGVQRALVIQPNSGYDDDNRCLIDVLARGGGPVQGHGDRSQRRVSA
jgi:predicted TIM-barrel fold metal-dependent hydrolase